MRIRRLVPRLASFSFAGLLLGAAAWAAPVPDAGSGTLFVRGAEGDAWRPAPVVATDVVLRVTGTIVRARVVQRFENPSARWLEGVYVFPLPEAAAVDHLDLRVGGRVIEGRIEERGEAKAVYEHARSEGRKASLVEQERPNVFTTSLANLGPGESVEVAIEYQEVLEWSAGEFRLRFPMVVGPRFIPGEPVAMPASYAGTGWGVATDLVPDAARITPPVLHPADGPVNPVKLRVELDAGFPLARVASPSHAVLVDELGPGRRLVQLGDYADRDFVLAWSPGAGDEPRVAVFSEPAPDGAHVLLMLMPESDAAADAAARLDREVVFVVDVSGSMGGASIEQARAALLLALGRLGPGDRFNVIRFSHETASLFPSAVSADAANLSRARDWVGALSAGGGTMMLPALERALSSDTGGGAVRQVVFVTDGSIGNEEELFAAIDRDLGRSRLFTVGIGSAPNGYFLRRAAKLGRGTHTFVANPGEVDERMARLFRMLERPVLADLEVSFQDFVEMWPERVPDLYAGEPIVLSAKVERFAGDVVVRGRRGGRPFEVSVALEPAASERGIGVLFARRKIESLMEALALGGDRARLRGEVIALALEHHLVTKYTSLVAVDVTPTRPRGEALATSAVPTNLPAGWDPVRVGGVLPRTATPGPWLRGLGALLLLFAGALALRPRPLGA